MTTFKLTSWNIEHFGRLFTRNSSAADQRRKAIADEIRTVSPDVLCVVEGPKSEQNVTDFCDNLLSGDWVPVFAGDGQYKIRGTQWIWFLVRKALRPKVSLLPPGTWDAFSSASWQVHYWGDMEEERHRHYRHPQVLVLDWDGLRVEFIGAHLKSKFVMGGESDWKAGGQQRETFVQEALKARIKLTTEAANIRSYIDAKFEQVANPAIFVMGDLNDGPGKEYFENQYLFFDLISNIQGDVFFARRFLNHALFDFPDELRWTVRFDDFIQEINDKPILLDHILFTQGLVDDSLSWKVEEHAGMVEHEAHDLINAELPSNGKTSDHSPVSCKIVINN